MKTNKLLQIHMTSEVNLTRTSSEQTTKYIDQVKPKRQLHRNPQPLTPSNAVALKSDREQASDPGDGSVRSDSQASPSKAKTIATRETTTRSQDGREQEQDMMLDVN